LEALAISRSWSAVSSEAPGRVRSIMNVVIVVLRSLAGGQRSATKENGTNVSPRGASEDLPIRHAPGPHLHSAAPDRWVVIGELAAALHRGSDSVDRAVQAEPREEARLGTVDPQVKALLVGRLRGRRAVGTLASDPRTPRHAQTGTIDPVSAMPVSTTVG
jgi:hypothetical protein